MRRWQADCLLGLAGLIWGFGFVAQKDAADHLGPFTFVAARFLVSALFVFPLAWREGGLHRLLPAFNFHDAKKIAGLCCALVGGVLFQQCGLVTATATDGAFITGVYIILVPFAGLALYRQKLTFAVFLASALSLGGVWLLTGADFRHISSGFSRGDGFLLLGAVCFAFQVAVLGHVVSALKMPFALSFLQYAATGLVALLLAVCFETIDLRAIAAAWLSILYAGVVAGGIAYTLQAVAQQHTPAADSAIVMSSESLFGAVGGAWLLHERLALSGYIGCAAIMASILLVECVPLLQARRGRP